MVRFVGVVKFFLAMYLLKFRLKILADTYCFEHDVGMSFKLYHILFVNVTLYKMFNSLFK